MIRRLPLAVTAALVLGFSLACTGDVASTPTPVPAPAPAALSPEAKAAAIADAIAADPSKADAALAAQGLTAEAYEALLFDIAADASRTKAYLDARKK